ITISVMNANTTLQNTPSMSTTSVTPRTQVSSGRGIGMMQTSRHLESRRLGSRNNGAQGDQNARVSVNNRRRNNNPHRKQTHQPSHNQRSKSDPDATIKGGNSSHSSSGDDEFNQVEELHSSVAITASELNDLSLNDMDPAVRC
ncbi:7778_t:CDS:2, partial [Acaulospora colombiana]